MYYPTSQYTHPALESFFEANNIVLPRYTINHLNQMMRDMEQWLCWATSTHPEVREFDPVNTEAPPQQPVEPTQENYHRNHQPQGSEQEVSPYEEPTAYSTETPDEPQQTKTKFSSSSRPTMVPPMQLRETDTHFEISLMMPGFSSEELNLTLENNVLTLQAIPQLSNDEAGKLLVSEWQRPNLKRTLKFNIPVDPENIQAIHQHGVLLITLTKAIPPVKQEHIIPIQSL